MNEPREEIEMEFPQGWRPPVISGTPLPVVAVAPPVRRRKNLWPVFAFLAFVVVAVGIGFFFYQEHVVGEDVPLFRSAVSFRSDAGHLDRNWFLEYAGFNKPGTGGVSVRTIKEKLADVGQVRQMKIPARRIIDDGVEVEVVERVPVFRYLYRSSASEKGEVRLVDAEGVVYAGVGYSGEFLETLPWLVKAVPVVVVKPKPEKTVPAKPGDAKADAAKLAAVPEKPEPVVHPRIPGVREMAMLVELARRNNPEICNQWDTISAEEFVEGRTDFPGAHIRVRLRPTKARIRGSRVRDIVFSADPSRYGFEFSAYTTPKVREWVSQELAQADFRETPFFDLCLFYQDRHSATGAAVIPVKQIRLVPVVAPAVVNPAVGQAGLRFSVL